MTIGANEMRGLLPVMISPTTAGSSVSAVDECTSTYSISAFRQRPSIAGVQRSGGFAPSLLRPGIAGTHDDYRRQGRQMGVDHGGLVCARGAVEANAGGDVIHGVHDYPASAQNLVEVRHPVRTVEHQVDPGMDVPQASGRDLDLVQGPRLRPCGLIQ